MAKKEKTPVVSCWDCEHSEMHQWFKNPVISICSVKKGERFVASCSFRCELFKRTYSKKEITHHDKY